MTPKTQAVSLLRTWLDVCKIPYNSSGENLAIQRQDGTFVPALFNPKNIMSTNLDVSLGEFRNVVGDAGYDRALSPVNRGAAPKKRMAEDAILARWRHNEMRTVPNADGRELREYDDVALREARIFTNRNRHLCAEMGYDVDVAHNDALIWTNTYLGRYKLRDEAAEGNRKLLTNYLRQRFKEMRDGLVRERRNFTPPATYDNFVESMTAEEPGSEWKEAHDQIRVKTPALRRQKAKELLKEAFEKMPHEAMIENLMSVVEVHPCVDTRKAAVKFLDSHRSSCSLCGTAQA